MSQSAAQVVRIARGRGGPRKAFGCAPGLTMLGGSVGQGGVNHRMDVCAAQSALNAIPYHLGGPQLKLAVDGIIGDYGGLRWGITVTLY